MLTIDEARKIRKALHLNPYEFSAKLGYSRTAYFYAEQRNRLSHGMSTRIAMVFGRVLNRVRKDGAR